MQQNVPEFDQLIKALRSEDVRFVVVGGLALILHGASYVTFDFDFAVSREQEIAAAIVRALAPFHPFPPEYGSAEHFVWDERSIVGAVIPLVTDAGHIDMLREQPGVDSFEGLWERSETRMVAGLDIHVASLDDLIAMKEAANRPKDREHLMQLRALKALQERE